MDVEMENIKVCETPEVAEMRQRVETDKRNILEHVLKMSSFYTSAKSTQPDSVNINNNNNTISDAEYASIFGDNDVDDDEDIFKHILKSAEEAFKRDKNLKKKDPLYKQICDDFKSPVKRKRKTKSKALQNSLNLMNTFKQTLKESQEKNKSHLNTVNGSIKSNQTSLVKSSGSSRKKSAVKIYPAWKTTATYTPIFTNPVNPKWANLKYTPKSSIYSTPNNPIHNEITDVDTEANVTSAYWNTESEDVPPNSIIDNESFKTPIISPIVSSTPMRSTIVRFKPSPPEHFSYSNYSSSSSSISPNPFLMEEDKLSDPDMPESFSEEYDDGNYQNFTPMFQDNYTERFEYYPEKMYKQKQNVEKMFDNENNDINKETIDNTSNRPTKEALYVEDFIRNLNYNINNNYNMEVKCSMKLKYFQ